MKEAARCLQCKTKPCVAGCPVAIDIPGFIKCIRDGDMAGAAEVMNKYTNLPAVCGRVCPQETQCEELCTVGKMPGFEPVAIGKLERLVADWKYTQEKAAADKAQAASKGKVAVVDWTSGLTVAGDLAKKGYEVTIFEALHAAGGVLIYGIPEFRLPKNIVKMEIDAMQDSRRQDRVQRGRRKEHHDAGDHGRVRCMLHRCRRRGSPFPGRTRHYAERCLFRKRIPHKDQPHARI